jgi:tetratricopeptide (TPR) repeat protein
MSLKKALPFVVLLLAACTAQQKQTLEDPLKPYKGSKALLFGGMGNHTREVSTNSPEAQRYFNQALALSFGFNHDEAIRSYAEAAKLDQDCAMAYWGMAYALGPNFNLPMDEANGKRAYAAIQEAIVRKKHASQTEQDMIDAMAVRYVNPPPAARAHLDKAFAEAMGKLWKKYPEDTDIGFIYAESMMNKRPWDQWEKDGTPKEDTLEVIRVLERVMELDINHPGANHMYMRVGRYKDSIDCNREASRVDTEYFRKVGPQGFYHVYHVHNDHFLLWTAMFEGRYEDAVKSADDMLAHLPEFLQALPDAACFLTTKLDVYIRFGKWAEIMAYPEPREDQPYAIAMWHYSRGIACANTRKIDDARAEARLFEEFAAKVPKAQLVSVVPAHEVLQVAREMLAGETAFKAGDHMAAFKHLRAAVEAEVAMRYTEPSPWLVPSRHALGALLLQHGEYQEAEKHYREDLAWYPENGWSLHGLAECLELSGKKDEAAAVTARFVKAWAHATVKIEGSCFCREHSPDSRATQHYPYTYASARRQLSAWARRRASSIACSLALPLPAISKAVPWSGEVRTIGRPSVTFTPSWKATVLIGARP